MSYLERLRAKFPLEDANPQLTKLTKPGYVSFGSAHPAPLRQISAANDEAREGPDLPLLAASKEYHALIDRLTCTEAERQRYHQIANCMSPAALLADLPKVRKLVKPAGAD